MLKSLIQQLRRRTLEKLKILKNITIGMTCQFQMLKQEKLQWRITIQVIFMVLTLTCNFIQ